MSELRQKYKLNDLVIVSAIPRSSCYYFMNDASKVYKYAHVRPMLKRIFHQNKGRYGKSSTEEKGGSIEPQDCVETYE